MYEFTPSFAQPSGSPIRELHKYLAIPGMISFAAGYPDSELFDVEGLGQAALTAYQSPVRCLQYTATEGLPVLREELIKLMHRRNTPCSSDELLVTTGSQQGWDLLLRVLITPGDSVLVEQPTYPATLQSLALQQAHVVAVSIDEEGLDVSVLRAMLEKNEFPRPPKLLYTIPNFANPSGATMPRERRLELLRLAVQYRLLVVEDDPYGEIRFSGSAVPSLLALSDEVPGSRDWLVHLASFSKIAAGGLRIGWMVAPPEIARRCVIAKQTIDLCSSSWAQSIAAEYLAASKLASHVPRIIQAYKHKCLVICAALRAAFGSELEFQQPEGGMFIWAHCPRVSSTVLLQYAIANKVLFVPGTAFFADSLDPGSFRISFATPSVKEIEEGVLRLRRAFDQAVAKVPIGGVEQLTPPQSIK
ncbi:PLP-dependent aminotransferase family protein [Alcaligenaceae bacterium CGII-47]|nr:PLP-dependent aminotransferase family protein [Alcaligenaceae bacterium CGII-47]